MRVADFFCGAGGFSEGFRQAGFQIIFAVDKWKPAVETYKGNKPQTMVIQDDVIRIAELPDDEFHKLVPDTEVIIGSPPCVAFSNSNKSGNGDKSLGIKLLKAYLKIIARKKYKKDSILKYWALENVPNIRKHIKSVYSAEELGLKGNFNLKVIYDSSGVYNAKYFGAPTSRKRFLCGEFPMIIATHNDKNLISMERILNMLGDPINSTQEYINDFNYSGLKLRRVDVTDHFYAYPIAIFEWTKAKRAKQDKGYMGKMAFPENIEKPSRTIMATMSACSRESIILENKSGGFRLPTVREIASLMGFPLDYKFFGNSKATKYTLVGNAVSPKLSFAIAAAICEVEAVEVPERYKRIIHDASIPFINLNNTEIEEKIEKQKRLKAKFKYHIPYLIINAYRVELTNYYSDFVDSQFSWECEIHFSQGKDRARVYKPVVNKNIFSGYVQNMTDLFIKNLKSKLCGSNEFQLRHCMTTERRGGLVGPYELLKEIKSFIEVHFSKDEMSELLWLEESRQNIPAGTCVGYYILNETVKNIKGV